MHVPVKVPTPELLEASLATTKLRNIGIAVTVPFNGAAGAINDMFLSAAALATAAELEVEARIFASVLVKVASFDAVTVPSAETLANVAKAPAVVKVNVPEQSAPKI